MSRRNRPTRQDARLTVDLTHYDPGRCAACGVTARAAEDRPGDQAGPLVTWEEYDEDDEGPTGDYVVLCRPCSEDLLERHPRLHRRLLRNEPAAGAMGICGPCVHRLRTTCNHPQAKRNGGPGILLTGPRPDRTHVNYGHGKVGWATRYPGPVAACTGRELGTHPQRLKS